MPLETLLMQPVSGDPSITYSARQIRAHLVGNLFGREGVINLRGGDLKVTQRGAGANFTVDVAVGRAAVFGDDQSDQGAYSINNTTTANVSVPAASTTTTRTHRVILQVQDRLENSAFAAGTYRSAVIVQADTAAGATMPPSSIPLGSIAVPANATSVTSSMVTDLRVRATAGTPAIEGTIPYLSSAYAPLDATRTPRWAVNADGWVQFSGALKRTGASTGIDATVQYALTTALDPAILPAPAAYRDFAGIVREGPVHFAVTPAGVLTIRYFSNGTMPSGTWINFDGCGYRL